LLAARAPRPRASSRSCAPSTSWGAS
jgi:hypothetical protein